MAADNCVPLPVFGVRVAVDKCVPLFGVVEECHFSRVFDITVDAVGDIAGNVGCSSISCGILNLGSLRIGEAAKL